MAILECGCDEAGRGSAIGGIYAGAVILEPSHGIEGLRDSKKLTAHRREILTEEIKSKSLAWSVAKATLEEIESLNVHHASLLAMKRAIEGLLPKPKKVYVDGLYIPQVASLGIEAEAIVKGDDKIAAISAASIIAKVFRDEAMLEYHKIYPEYGFERHKGYLTKEHLAALSKYGPCAVHRRSYAPVRERLSKKENGGKLF